MRTYKFYIIWSVKPLKMHSDSMIDMTLWPHGFLYTFWELMMTNQNRRRMVYKSFYIVLYSFKTHQTKRIERRAMHRQSFFGGWAKWVYELDGTHITAKPSVTNSLPISERRYCRTIIIIAVRECFCHTLHACMCACVYNFHSVLHASVLNPKARSPPMELSQRVNNSLRAMEHK